MTHLCIGNEQSDGRKRVFVHALAAPQNRGNTGRMFSGNISRMIEVFSWWDRRRPKAERKFGAITQDYRALIADVVIRQTSLVFKNAVSKAQALVLHINLAPRGEDFLFERCNAACCMERDGKICVAGGVLDEYFHLVNSEQRV